MRITGFEQAGVKLIDYAQRTSTALLIRLARQWHPSSAEWAMFMNVLSDRVARSENGMSEADRCEMIGHLDAASDVAMAADDAERVAA